MLFYILTSLGLPGVIPEGGLVVSVDAPNLSEFDLDGISVEGGEIEAVRDGGFDLRMMEYTALVNLPIAEDGETALKDTLKGSTGSTTEGTSAICLRYPFRDELSHRFA